MIGSITRLCWISNSNKISEHFMPDAHFRAIMLFKSETKYFGSDLGGAAGY